MLYITILNINANCYWTGTVISPVTYEGVTIGTINQFLPLGKFEFDEVSILSQASWFKLSAFHHF